MKGIILAGGKGTRLHPLTHVTSKQLLPVYDKPMIFYPLSVLMKAGIREICIITTPEDRSAYMRLLKDGSQWGITLSYMVQEVSDGIASAFIIAEEFLNNQPSCLILGDNIFHGELLDMYLKKASLLTNGAMVFGYEVVNPERYGVFAFNENGEVEDIIEKPKHPPSNFAVTGLYFYDGSAAAKAKTLRPSPRGEYEITDLNRCYLQEGSLQVQKLQRGFAWLDTGTHESLFDAATYVRSLQQRQGIQVACLEEIAYEEGFIGFEELEKAVRAYGSSEYGVYLYRYINKIPTSV